jgi:hypothetical protein
MTISHLHLTAPPLPFILQLRVCVMAAPIGIDIRDKKLVFNGKIRIFQGVLG